MISPRGRWETWGKKQTRSLDVEMMEREKSTIASIASRDHIHLHLPHFPTSSLCSHLTRNQYGISMHATGSPAG